MKIAVVGGSLSGCMAAILLGRKGHDVTIYERSRSGLVGRGGGLTTSRAVLDEMKALDLLDADFPATTFNHLRMMKRTEVAPYLGVNPLSRPIRMQCVHWGGLWSNLVKRVPEADYLRGRTLTKAVACADRVSLTFADGATKHADLALFCDGYNSMGRRLMFPDAKIVYRGYIVWRGTLPDNAVSDHAPLNEHPRYSYTAMHGSFVSFVVPSSDGSIRPGERTINWAAYIPLPEDGLKWYFTDSEGRFRAGTVPSGAVNIAVDRKLKDLMTRELPEFYADIVRRSDGNQLQQIYTTSLPAYGKDRMCLMGDAGMVVQPMTGSGLFKGFSNARDLAAALDRFDSLALAVDEWSRKQACVARKMLDLGNQMEDAFIWNTIDLAQASPEACAAWWDRSIQIPSAFSYFA